MLWSFFLHLYQPTNQAPEVIKNVVESSYRPLLSLLEETPRAKLALNINACLSEQLLKYGFDDVLHRLRVLAQKGKVEFVASAKYHPILPLIPENEVAFQIKAGLATNQRILGKVYKPSGFFPTELAFDRKVARVAKRLGFKWLLADEISLTQKLGEVLWNKIYKDRDGLFLVFANRFFIDLIRRPSKLTAERFTSEVEKFKDKHSFIVTANDAEVFGHHYESREFVLKKIFEDPQIEPILVSQLFEKIKKEEEIVPHKGTWETNSKDILENRPFALWFDPQNLLQRLCWDLAWLAIKTYWRRITQKEVLEDEEKEPGYFDARIWARRHLNSGLHSCNFWWASLKPWWNPDMVVSGATPLIKVIRSLDVPKEDKLHGEKLYTKIIETTWKWHWSGFAQTEIDKFDRQK